MSFGADEEILQDFLVEAGEILEQLSEQLVELESRPDDMNLLNAIFRGFHTVKGGAGFLQLNELVECCHIAENVFDILRKGSRRVDSELMDVVLEALDAVNGMFTEVRERVELTPATPQLLAALARLAEPASAVEVVAEAALSRSLRSCLSLSLSQKSKVTSPIANSISCLMLWLSLLRLLRRPRWQRRAMRLLMMSLKHYWTSCMARGSLLLRRKSLHQLRPNPDASCCSGIR